jgi:Saxitoxin biosynthesis operon protein SxtJ
MNHNQEAGQRLPSNHTFGWFFALVFILGATYTYWQNHHTGAMLLGAIAVIFVVLTVVKPSLLSPLNRLWFKLGVWLGKIVSPLVLGFLFLVLITPVAVVTRLCGRDELLLKKRDVKSYWVERNPPGPLGESFHNQF